MFRCLVWRGEYIEGGENDLSVGNFNNQCSVLFDLLTKYFITAFVFNYNSSKSQEL